MKRDYRLPTGCLVVSELINGSQRWYQVHGPITTRDVFQLAAIAGREALETYDRESGGSSAAPAAAPPSSSSGEIAPAPPDLSKGGGGAPCTCARKPVDHRGPHEARCFAGCGACGMAGEHRPDCAAPEVPKGGGRPPWERAGLMTCGDCGHVDHHGCICYALDPPGDGLRCLCDRRADEDDQRCTDPGGHAWHEGPPDRGGEGPIRCIHCGADGDA